MESHAGLGNRVAFVRDEVVGLAELDANKEAQIGRELVHELRVIALTLGAYLFVNVAQLGAILERTDELFFQLQQVLVVILHLLRWLHHDGSHNVGAVVLVAEAESANDCAKMEIVLVTSRVHSIPVKNTSHRAGSEQVIDVRFSPGGAEFEVVVATALDNSWVADLHECLVTWTHELGVTDSRFDLLGQLRMLHFL